MRNDEKTIIIKGYLQTQWSCWTRFSIYLQGDSETSSEWRKDNNHKRLFTNPTVMLNSFQHLFLLDSETSSEWQKDNNHKRLFINPTVMLNSFQHLFLLNSEINSEWLYTRLLRRFAVKEMLRNKLNKLNLLQKRKNHLFKWRVWKADFV